MQLLPFASNPCRLVLNAGARRASAGWLKPSSKSSDRAKPPKIVSQLSDYKYPPERTCSGPVSYSAFRWQSLVLTQPQPVVRYVHARSKDPLLEGKVRQQILHRVASGFSPSILTGRRL